ncbi:metallo-beta-lactamase family protein [Colletotrichum costaricense]|uniref:Metallo-beta-lactamase family protein n=1 Tax=Colletotrichum costaricense TaxID=1209916 RepID=A0AAI9Z665_9PEZI|nr:metallo-beta-lactamase family protein [Colletotrichum costaricense]KAK1536450.1 metallo-beta-lactamase family protein [Colletotrichum costaricense]
MKSFNLMTLALSRALAVRAVCSSVLQVENFISSGPSLDMVSSLIIGSEAALLIDMPLAVPQAEELAAWVVKTTDKPLVAVFTTHFHPDHYLSGSAFLAHFPEAKYYANSQAVALIENEVEDKLKIWSGILGADAVVEKATVPTPYDFTFFVLPGNENEPIELLSPLVADTIDETLFWIPSIKTLIAGDSVYSHTVHLWLADLLSPALTSTWLSTLDFIQHLKPAVIIPGHALSVEGFGPSVDVEHSRRYVSFFQKEIEAKGLDFFTPADIVGMLDGAFPGLLNGTSQTSKTLVDISGDQFGRNGTRQVHYVDLASYNKTAELEGWKL